MINTAENPTPSLELVEATHWLAATAPKISLDDSRIFGETAIKSHVQFRDHFFERFGEIKAAYEGKADPEQIIYLRTIKERFGFDLVAFYVDHQALCDSIVSAVEAKQPYDQLKLAHDTLLDHDPTDLLGRARSLDQATGHPLGIEAVGMFYWDVINPLLEIAYDRMGNYTLNAPYLGYDRQQ